MHPRMSPNELALFLSFLKKSERYLEFGTGGSTFAASSHVNTWVISVDSCQEWLDKVSSACAENSTKPELIFADIGPTGDWGFPIDPSTKSRWPGYHSSVWGLAKSNDADLYLIDGRFRVACFAQVVLHSSHNAIIGFHDFDSRANYHCVRGIAREVAAAEDMSFFQPLPNTKANAAKMLEEFMFNPA
jgi:hypothetical protein